MSTEKSSDAGQKEAGIISTAQAAALLKCTPNWIRQLEKQGFFKKAGRDQYKLVAVVHGYVDFKNSEDRRSSKTAADARVRDARAREVELKIAEREGRLIEYVEAEGAIDYLVGLYRSEFAGLPARVTRDLQLRRTIEQAVNDTLSRIADAAEKRARALGPDRASVAPVPAANA